MRTQFLTYLKINKKMYYEKYAPEIYICLHFQDD
jgi:hypothetical protein